MTEYEDATTGVTVQAHNTQILGPQAEPQPDACLIVLPEYGGRTWVDEDDYLHGPPELVAEVSASTESIDLHAKKRDYEKAGVLEYLVIALESARVFWFVRRAGRFRELPPAKEGLLRSSVFPGLWLDPVALLRRDRKRLLAVLRKGLASPEHAAFVKALEKRRR